MTELLTSWVKVTACRPELALPFVCDSPHSGTHYPKDFNYALAKNELRSCEDTHVDQLWMGAPELGATFITAEFPRSYIDVNRPLIDLDIGMLAEPWINPVVPTGKTELGMGLIWRQVRANMPIYARKLSTAEVQHRIEVCWKPYYAEMRAITDRMMGHWGCYWHLNLHSMPSNAYERLGIVSETPLADFVLGDLSGLSCEPEFISIIRLALEERGYRVAVNDPYKGQELVREFGRPSERCHSLQVEINRSLYMNELTREPSSDFKIIQADLFYVLEYIAQYIREKIKT